MKAYKIELARPAQNYLSRLDRPTKERIVRVLWQLAENPESNLLDIKPMTGRSGQLRLRIGDYRVIFRIEKDVLIIYVIAIGSRGDVYK